MKLQQRTINLNEATELLTALSAARNGSAEDIAPPLSKLLSWSDLKGIHAAAERIARAITKSETIAIVGDYDADGATATAVLLMGLRTLGATVVSVIPSRIAQGYGLSPSVVEHVRTTGASLIVTVDNGIVAFAGIEAAQKCGIDVVVTDHHQIGRAHV